MKLIFTVIVFCGSLLSCVEAGTECDAGWKAYNGHCWGAYTVQLTQPKAVDACHKNGAQLASIHSLDEYKFVESLMDSANSAKDKAFYIGLKITRDTADKNLVSMSWTDGTQMTFGNTQHFNTGSVPWGFYGEKPEPNNLTGQEACVRHPQSKMFANMKKPGWIDSGCTELGGYICKK